MPVYMIGYDLHPSEGENYSELYTALETIGSSGYWDCLDSTWLVITEKTAAQIKDVLKQYLKDGDRPSCHTLWRRSRLAWVQGRLSDMA